jgi:hypothetical protein
MKCPHCLTEFHDVVERIDLGKDSAGDWVIFKYDCPNPICKKAIFHLVNCSATRNQFGHLDSIQHVKSERLVYPKAANRQPPSLEVPDDFKRDYLEACLVLPDSAMASAALSRRCLQNILRQKGGFTSRNLAEEIQQAIDSRTLPSHIVDSIDAIRNIGNFAAHPLKSTNTGEIIPVEPGEAEWTLDVIEFLFDFYFVQPALIQKKRAELNKKLSDAGKPQMK